MEFVKVNEFTHYYSNTRFFVGMPILFVEDYGISFYPAYSYVHLKDKIKEIEVYDPKLGLGSEVVHVLTEAGVKLKVSQGNDNYGSLVLRGSFPLNTGLVNEFYGLERPTYLGDFYNNKPIYKFEIQTFGSDKLIDSYIDDMKNQHQRDLEAKKEEWVEAANQMKRKKEALQELRELVNKNNKIREELSKQEYELEQKLIKERCKRYDASSDGQLYCKER